MTFHTSPGVARVESILLRPIAAADAKQPGQDHKREEHRGESQSDLLGRGQHHPQAERATAGR